MEFSSEAELETYVQDPTYSDKTKVYAAIVFPAGAGGSEVDVSYTIRVNSSSVPDTDRMTSRVRAAPRCGSPLDTLSPSHPCSPPQFSRFSSSCPQQQYSYFRVPLNVWGNSDEFSVCNSQSNEQDPTVLPGFSSLQHMVDAFLMNTQAASSTYGLNGKQSCPSAAFFSDLSSARMCVCAIPPPFACRPPLAAHCPPIDTDARSTVQPPWRASRPGAGRVRALCRWPLPRRRSQRDGAGAAPALASTGAGIADSAAR